MRREIVVAGVICYVLVVGVVIIGYIVFDAVSTSGLRDARFPGDDCPLHTKHGVREAWHRRIGWKMLYQWIDPVGDFFPGPWTWDHCTCEADAKWEAGRQQSERERLKDEHWAEVNRKREARNKKKQ